MMIDLRTGVPEDKVAADYEREAEAIERQAWNDVVDGGITAAIGGAELDRAKRLRQESAERRAARIPSPLPDPIFDRLARVLGLWEYTS